MIAIFTGFIGVLIVVHPGVGELHPAFLLRLRLDARLRLLHAADALSSPPTMPPLVMLFYSVLLGAFVLAPFAIWQWVWPQTPARVG